MKFAIIGGNTRWSKILIENFKKQNHTLIYTSSRYIDLKNNFKNIKKIPLEKIDFIVLCSDTMRNFKAAKFFISQKKPVFIEKPITNSYANFTKLRKLIKKNSLFFADYQHMYSDVVNFLIKRIHKEKLISIKILFGKNGPKKKINSSYEWLPHPLSIFFSLLNIELNLQPIYQNFINKKKTNLVIDGIIQNKVNLYIKSGNNFKKKIYELDILTNKNLYFYDASKPNSLIIIKKDNTTKKRIQKFKNYPLFNSIKTFSEILKNENKKKRYMLKYNQEVSEKIMKYLHINNL